MHLIRKLAATLAAAAAATIWAAGPASAHIEPSPAAVEAGSAATVGFKVEHGCDESPTTKLEMELPVGTTDIKGVDGDGWTSSVDGRVVTFTGGPLPAHEPRTFQVSFTAPTKAGRQPVKIVQTCEQGSLDWIETAADGEPEPENPAPVIDITPGQPTAEESAGEHDHDAGASTDAEPADDEHDAAPTEAGSGEHDDAAAGDRKATADADDGSDSSSTGPIVIGVVAAVVVIGGAGLFLFRRRSAS